MLLRLLHSSVDFPLLQRERAIEGHIDGRAHVHEEVMGTEDHCQGSDCSNGRADAGSDNGIFAFGAEDRRRGRKTIGRGANASGWQSRNGLRF